MTLPDIINAVFEISGGFFIGLNIREIVRDKQLKGTSLFTIMFFTAWGIWNLYFYSHLEQFISFFGGIVITCMNVVWFGLVIRYKYFYKGELV